ncbi:hypothetical protein Scep_015740 [Stephania cephalantha]|uniref:Reverse transcriptase n=1 Tax=Stephania cephalantha TaxID=152367 RepID=A0AAP0P1R7_9MAGN
MIKRGWFTAQREEVARTLEKEKHLLSPRQEVYPQKRKLQHVYHINSDSYKDLVICKALHDNKAPGPDGYTTLFFKKTCDIVGADFMAAVSNFFKANKMIS